MSCRGERLAGKTMPAIRQSRPARAVQSPTGALIATQPRNCSPAGAYRMFPYEPQGKAAYHHRRGGFYIRPQRANTVRPYTSPLV